MVAAGILTVGAFAPVAAQAPYVWTNQTELSFVATGGNASSSTLGLKSALLGKAAENAFKLEVGGIRGETNFRQVTANGTPGSFTVSETTMSELTAESYFAKARYDRSFGSGYAFGGSGWDRNTFAGIQNRFQFITGIGRAWVESETATFKTDIAATYTVQKDVSPAPGADDAFGGIRLSIEAMRKLSEAAEYTSVLIVDENAETTEDYRADWTNALSVSLSERLAFKTALQLLFDNSPSLQSVPLFTAGVPAGTVLTPGQELDSVLTLALVIKM
jgi:putative salt-induced outer membrane protein YdiY